MDFKKWLVKSSWTSTLTSKGSFRFSLISASRHPERHHPTLLVLAHLHHSLHWLFDRRGHRFRSLGTWDNGRQQATHPAEGWKGGQLDGHFLQFQSWLGISISHPIFLDLSQDKKMDWMRFAWFFGCQCGYTSRIRCWKFLAMFVH